MNGITAIHHSVLQLLALKVKRNQSYGNQPFGSPVKTNFYHHKLNKRTYETNKNRTFTDKTHQRSNLYLTIEGGRVMARPERREQVLVLALPGIVLDPDNLGVVGGPGADILVGDLVEVPLTVSDLGLGHPGHPLERELHPPEAPRPELRKFLPRRRHVQVRPLRDRRRRLRREPPAAPEP